MSNITVRNHWFPMGLFSFVMAVFVATLFAATAASLYWLATKNTAIAILAWPLVFGVAMFLMRGTLVKRGAIVGKESGESPGENTFAEKWVLDLAVMVPHIVIKGVSMVELEQQLRGHYETVQTAVKYFPEGKYCVRRNGTMRRLSDTEAAELSGLTHVVAKIYFEDLPFSDVMARRLAARPSSILERGLNCALVDVDAYGTAQRGSLGGRPCVARFAARNGKLIVESLT